MTKHYDNCIICGSNISERESNAKYCTTCSKLSRSYRFINGVWIQKDKYYHSKMRDLI